MTNQQETKENKFTIQDFNYWLNLMVMEGYAEEASKAPPEFYTFNPIADPPGPYQPEPDRSEEPEQPDWNNLPEPVYPYHCTVEEQIDGTHVIVSTECGGTERLDEKVKRLISSEKEEICA